ncbi:LysR family transcriptional regulator [Vibrio sp. TH_r3]|uniref:LysR family transcriptional regulator n=1 Tax=Vibrio sp. TH_r3 TaxID=3082084 RepID=UPI002954FF9F|nr:LysR family transcriptional regulator [Vibrio sp. TH_r3]MDV7103325.1 LysR family transcriptional regulator [Vibrio sp. TH_r3]
MLNPLWLNTFRTLVEVEHFTKTAEQLFMTQPGVSQHIKKLEAQLGTELLQKMGKQFELTEAGKQVYQYALSLQNNEKALIESIKIDSPYVGECLFAMSGSLCMQFQPIFLDRQLQHQDLLISLESAPNHRIVEGLLSGKVEIGIVTQKIPTLQLEYKLIGKEKLCIIVPQSFDTQEWTLESLKTLGLIHHPDCEHYLLQYLSSFNQEHELKNIRKSGYINQLSQILYPVAKGLGFTILPMSAVTAFPQQNEIQILPLKKQIEEPLYQVTKRSRELPVRYHWFINTMQERLTST